MINNILKQKFEASKQSNDNIFESYTNVKDEYYSLLHGIGVRNISHNTILKLEGKDVLDFLHRVSTNSIKDLQLFQKVTTLFTNEKGRLIDRTTLIRMGDHYYLVGDAPDGKKLESWISKYVISEDIKLETISGEFILLELIGPQTNSYLSLISESEINDMNEYDLVRVDNGEIKFYLMKQTAKKVCCRYWLLAEPEYAEKLVDHLIDNKSVFDFNFVGEEAYNIFRVENGIVRAPNELNDNVNPHEAELMDEISSTKGCYIGQEVIARLDTYDKVQRKLSGVVFSDDTQESGTIKLFDSEQNEVGIVTSVVQSEKFNKKIGLAFIKKQYAEVGINLVTFDGDKESIVTVTNLPFAL